MDNKKIFIDYKVYIPTIIALSFIVYGHYFPNTIQKPMIDKKLTVDFDLWSATHFLLFFYFGTLYPKKLLFFASIGIIWELTEDYLASDESKRLVDCKLNKGTIWCKGYQDGYWYAKWDDVFVNIFGFLCGSYIACNSKVNLHAID